MQEKIHVMNGIVKGFGGIDDACKQRFLLLFVRIFHVVKEKMSLNKRSRYAEEKV